MKFKFFGLKAPDWKKVRVLGILLVAGLLLLTLRLPGGGGRASGSGGGVRPAAAPLPGARSPAASAQPSAALPADPIASQQVQIERSLTRILGRVAGAGTVHVAVALAGGEQRRFATDTTTSRTTTSGGAVSAGGSTTTQDSVRQQVVLVHGGSAGADAPVTAQVLRPEVRGVLVVATGATSPVVRAEISQAAAAAAGVPIYRVVVLPAAAAGSAATAPADTSGRGSPR